MELELKFQVQTKIKKPVNEVFDAVYNPKKLSGYFVGQSSGPLDEGKTVYWNFSDFPGEFPVEVKQVIPNKLIVLEWESQEGGYNTRTEMHFEALDSGSTLVRMSESGWKTTPKGLEYSYSSCHGWTQMSCCLKAYLEYGINLRKGFY